ncbi:SMP-30/gluconolactonase/LRE family protein [Spirosoma sp. BT702]|uniref:SMP-30/gluconolactonase/LRE family protein n=1 Tax=Spirosoma profusum TaxID=2771354 RepID=A0A926XV14_9BACT|nr:SMP-30/gluconolactonase/LRE family protein [Spirosoma profusum]MBD2700852.1 SMP-30/gluconolactonase/LRE family protein [Spirosoma profusum]
MKQTLLVATALLCDASLLSLTLPLPAAKPPKLVKVWETDTTLRTPESVLFDGSNTLYVANIDGKSDALDGSGFISKVSLDGKIENLQWTAGLNAPKGMGLYKNRLYVTDVHRLVCINTSNGQAEKTWDAVGQGAFLNDVTVDKEGTVYVSDNRNNKVYRLKEDKWEVFMEGEPLNNPNGLYAVGTDKLMVGNTKTGALCALDLKTKTLKQLADGMANTDGIVPEGKGNFFVSDWNGRLFHIAADGTKTELLDTRPDKVNAADIEYVAKKKLLVVPTFLKNKLVAYKVE